MENAQKTENWPRMKMINEKTNNETSKFEIIEFSVTCVENKIEQEQEQNRTEKQHHQLCKCQLYKKWLNFFDQLTVVLKRKNVW